MNINRFLYLFVAIALAVVGGLTVREAHATTSLADSISTGSYQAMLGKSLYDKDVANFIAANNCSIEAQTNSGQWGLCRDAGMALWMDSTQTVKAIWLYAGNADGFKRYRGKLPFGLTFYDPMWLVEEKLGNIAEDDTSTDVKLSGLPDAGGSPDHIHYWAEYKKINLIVIYETPFADEDAYIYAIVLNSN